MGLQEMINAMNDASSRERASYHLTLGGLVALLESAPPEAPVRYDFGGGPSHLHSYRGHYTDLSLGTDEEMTAADLLASCRSAIGKEFTGYKGGDFLMGECTPLWAAEYGDCGRAVMSGSVVDGAVVLVTKEV